MLSKEEIEKAKRYFEDEIHYEKTTYNCVNHYRQTIIDNHIILYKYIKQLESDKQKLIEKLEEDNKRNKETVTYYEQARRDCKDESEYKKIYQNNINTLNAKREVRKEILEILKGEKE